MEQLDIISPCDDLSTCHEKTNKTAATGCLDGVVHMNCDIALLLSGMQCKWMREKSQSRIEKTEHVSCDFFDTVQWWNVPQSVLKWQVHRAKGPNSTSGTELSSKPTSTRVHTSDGASIKQPLWWPNTQKACGQPDIEHVHLSTARAKQTTLLLTVQKSHLQHPHFAKLLYHSTIQISQLCT